MPTHGAQLAESLGLEAFVSASRARSIALRHYLEPTCNIDGLTSGYQGPGAKTILPG